MDGGLDGSHEANDMTKNAGDESDTLSDIDDVEVHFTFSFISRIDKLKTKAKRFHCQSDIWVLSMPVLVCLKSKYFFID